MDLNAEPDTLRAELEAQFNPPETPVVETPEPEAPAPADSFETAQDTGAFKTEVTEPLADHPTDPTRYANGKFKPTKSEAAPTQVEPGQEIPSTDTTAKASAVAATQPDAPPAGWTAEGKAAWSALAKEIPSLSPAAQAVVRAVQTAALARDTTAAAGSQQWSEEKRRYDTALAPVATLARGRGMEVGQAVQLLAAAQNMLDQNPVEGLKRIAASYGVDLATLAGQSAEVPAQSQPDIATLVRQAVSPILAPIQERWQTEEQQRKQSSISLIDQFAAEPGHEHYAALESEILAVLPLVQQAKPGATQKEWLQEAYDRAVYVNPQTRASILAAREAQAEAKRVADAKARADKARRAGSSVSGAPNGQAAVEPKDSLRAEIEAAFAGS